MNAKSPPTPKSPPQQKSAERLSIAVAERLRLLISKESGSFERLAERSGIDPADLLRIESGAQAPTIGDLWRIANALGVPFGSLVASRERQGVLVISGAEPQALGSSDGAFLSRPLFPYESERGVEFYQVVVAPGHIERAEAHPPGTKENLVVAHGEVEIAVGREAPVRLRAGDAVDFLADVPHSYQNIGAESATLYLVMSYARLDARCA